MSGIRFGGWTYYYKWRQVRCFSYTANTTADCLLQNNLHRILGTMTENHSYLWQILNTFITGLFDSWDDVLELEHKHMLLLLRSYLPHPSTCTVTSTPLLGHDVRKLPRYKAAITLFSDFTSTSYGIQIFNNSTNVLLLVTRPHVTKRTRYKQLANV
jgi:hypothetical protein